MKDRKDIVEYLFEKKKNDCLFHFDNDYLNFLNSKVEEFHE